MENNGKINSIRRLAEEVDERTEEVSSLILRISFSEMPWTKKMDKKYLHEIYSRMSSEEDDDAALDYYDENCPKDGFVKFGDSVLHTVLNGYLSDNTLTMFSEDFLMAMRRPIISEKIDDINVENLSSMEMSFIEEGYRKKIEDKIQFLRDAHTNFVYYVLNTRSLDEEGKNRSFQDMMFDYIQIPVAVAILADIKKVVDLTDPAQMQHPPVQKYFGSHVSNRIDVKFPYEENLSEEDIPSNKI